MYCKRIVNYQGEKSFLQTIFKQVAKKCLICCNLFNCWGGCLIHFSLKKQKARNGTLRALLYIILLL